MKLPSTLLAVAIGLAASAAAPPQTRMHGYTIVSGARERALEARFIDIPSAQSELEIAATIGARTHYAGTPGDYALAVSMRDTMRAAGIRSELEPFRAVVDTPRELVLAVAPPPDPLGPETRNNHRGRESEFPVALDLRETGDASDPATTLPGVGLPFNAGSADGDVKAPLVFADRGREFDYDTLAAAHVEVSGAVIIMRYGAEFRGLLAERAQAHGAAGVIFYSDPADDGDARGAVYPNGPWRPAAAVERGSVGSAIRIPTLPVSARNARTLIGALRGTSGPLGWGGALPVTYPLARGPGRVHLIVKLNRRQTTLWNTIGIIPGVHGDQSVVLGAHRDAWVYGVADNGDGVGTMLEVTRGLGFLLRGGWQPQRTIVIAGWDGEDSGLAGSRTYTRAHRIELERGCFAYLNADENITGTSFSADAVAALAQLVFEVTRSVSDPARVATTVFERWAAQTPKLPPRVTPPGGGSDHESFLSSTGTPVANLHFDGPFGAYNSSYDTLRYATLYSDPGFVLHRASAQMYGLLALRLADADSVPYVFSGYVTTMREGMKRMQARGRTDRSTSDTAGLAQALDRYALAALAFDTSDARTQPDDSVRALHAARMLDLLLYGTNGYAAAIFPDIDAAFATHRKPTIDAALAHVAQTLTHATDDLTDLGASR